METDARRDIALSMGGQKLGSWSEPRVEHAGAATDRPTSLPRRDGDYGCPRQAGPPSAAARNRANADRVEWRLQGMNAELRMRRCALCGRSLEDTGAWKGRGETYYCSEFCADAEPIEASSFVPTANADASAPAHRSAALGLRERPATAHARAIPRVGASVMRPVPGDS